MSKELYRSTDVSLPNVNPALYFKSRYQSRLNDYLAFTNSQYGVPTELATIIVSVLIPCQPYKPVWLIVESEPHPFWEHLSAALKILGYPTIHDVSTPTSDMYEWLSERNYKPRIMIDTSAEAELTDENWDDTNTCFLLTRQSVRVTATIKKQIPAYGAEVELATLLRLVIDPKHRVLMPRPVQILRPICRLIEVMKWADKELELNVALEDSLAMIPSSHAVAEGRDYLIPDDWDVLHTVLRGMVRPLLRPLLRYYHREILSIAWFHRWDRIRKLPNAKLLRRSDWPYLSTTSIQTILSNLHRCGWLKTYNPSKERRLWYGFDRKAKYYIITHHAKYVARMLLSTRFDIMTDIKIGELNPKERNDGDLRRYQFRRKQKEWRKKY